MYLVPSRDRYDWPTNKCTVIVHRLTFVSDQEYDEHDECNENE